MDQPKEPDAGPHVRFCERRDGAIHCAYSTVAKQRVPTRATARTAAIFLDRADSPGATIDRQRPSLVGERLQGTCAPVKRP
jgi:hypothetical protein